MTTLLALLPYIVAAVFAIGLISFIVKMAEDLGGALIPIIIIFVLVAGFGIAWL